MREFVIDKCELVEESIRLVEVYTKNIRQPLDFNVSEENSIKLDTSMMRLQAIG